MFLSAGVPLLFPQTLGMKGRGGVRAAAEWAWGAALGPYCKARGGSGGGTLSPSPPLTRVPLRDGVAWWGLCGWGWRWETPAVFRETRGNKEKVMLDFQIQALGRLQYIWKDLELRPQFQHGGWCWH